MTRQDWMDRYGFVEKFQEWYLCPLNLLNNKVGVKTEVDAAVQITNGFQKYNYEQRLEGSMFIRSFQTAGSMRKAGAKWWPLIFFFPSFFALYLDFVCIQSGGFMIKLYTNQTGPCIHQPI